MLHRFQTRSLAAIVVGSTLAGSRLGRWPIVAPEAIADMQPDLILIAAESSGPAIYRDLEARQGRATLLPLYDMGAPVWRVMLP